MIKFNKISKCNSTLYMSGSFVIFFQIILLGFFKKNVAIKINHRLHYGFVSVDYIFCNILIWTKIIWIKQFQRGILLSDKHRFTSCELIARDIEFWIVDIEGKDRCLRITRPGFSSLIPNRRKAYPSSSKVMFFFAMQALCLFLSSRRL